MADLAKKDTETLRDKIKAAPTQPGCYLFMDRHGYIIYVGKAKNLKNRVKSYFTKAAALDERIAELAPKIVDAEFRVTASELDALFLEYRLIKQYKPWFNSQMKADKLRPYLRIADTEPYPTLTVCSQMQEDGASYYDFFIDEDDVRQTLALFCKVWGLPQCGQRSFKKPRSPCVYHKLDGCMAPCGGKADLSRYAAAVSEVEQFLTGKSLARIRELKQEMQAAADALAFEKAAIYKDLLDDLRRVQHKSRRRFHMPEKGATLILIRPFREAAFSCFYAVDGTVLQRVDFPAAPDNAAIDVFVESLGPAAPPQADDAWMADCLVDVMADKQFILLPQGKAAQRVAAKAIRKFIK